MVEVYRNIVKEDEVLSADVAKPAAYQKFAFNVTGTGYMMPTGVLTDFSLQFGGNGADGDFSLTGSETLDIDVGGAKVYEINWKSLNITGTASLTFSNPHAEGTLIFIKVQGDTTLTSTTAPMIDASGMGAAGAATTTNTSCGGYCTITDIDGDSGKLTPFITNAGLSGTAVPGVGTGGAIISASVFTGLFVVTSKYSGMFVGAGGGAGNLFLNAAGAAISTGTGGRGGGGLVIEVGGSFNFTTTNGVSVAGDDGTVGDPTSQAGANRCAAGGGGGGGGSCFILYRTLIANSGTVNVSGGTGGNRSAGTGTVHGGGGGGSGSNVGVNGTSSSSSGAKTGGNGGAGYSLVAQNTYYA